MCRLYLLFANGKETSAITRSDLGLFYNSQRFNCKIETEKSSLMSDSRLQPSRRAARIKTAARPTKATAPQDPARVHTGHLACVIHARTHTRERVPLSLLLAVKSFGRLAGSLAFLPLYRRHLMPPGYPRGELSFRPAVSCVTPRRVHGIHHAAYRRRRDRYPAATRRPFPRVRRTRCTVGNRDFLRLA